MRCIPERIKLRLFRIMLLLIMVTVLYVVDSVVAVADSGEGSSVSVRDFRNKTLTFHHPVQRIVCLIESALSGLYMLGAERLVVGVSTNIYQAPIFDYYSLLDERIAKKAISTPGNWDFVNIESVVALKPDVVILWSSQTEAISALESRGIKVFGVFIEHQDDVLREIQEFGRMTANEARAEELLSYARAQLQSLRQRNEHRTLENRPSLYFMWSQGKLDTSCGNSIVQDVVDLAGGRNVCAEIPSEHQTISLEKLVEWNPDVIVMWKNDKLSTTDLLQDQQLRTVAAIRTRQVYQFTNPFVVDLWTLKSIYATQLISSWLYPLASTEDQPRTERDKMLTFLYRRDLSMIAQ